MIQTPARAACKFDNDPHNEERRCSPIRRRRTHRAGRHRGKLRAQGVTRHKRVVCYCGGGISATIDLFVLHQLGYDDLTLYDGSMGEWAKDLSLPIETD